METNTSGYSGNGRPSFADLLRRARIAAALSQEELAGRAGLSARGISDLERGLHPTPRLETVRMLADALALDDDARVALIAAARPATVGFPLPAHPFAPLPVPPTRLVGRKQEIALLSDMLRDDEVRLLTLTGTGGSGKTRVALAVASELVDIFRDGVVFVDLAPLADPALVLAAVAQALGLKDPRGAGPEEVVRSYLINKRLLLLLDNFEHLLDAAPCVTQLLSVAPAVKVLATSREPLRLRGERVFLVLPLALPGPADAGNLTRFAASEAVTLFVERARDARSDFKLTAENAGSIAEICRRLDGLPLALELAAAHIRALPPRALLERLGRALPMLTSGARDAPARQRTLRDTIAWSYDLLNEQEQKLMRALGVFAGGWTLDAAEAINELDDDPIVFETLTSLVEKNLVRLVDASEEPRYAMLGTIREFALQQLIDYGEERAVRDRHVAWCMTFADTSMASKKGFVPTQSPSPARLDLELGNVRAGLEWLHRIRDERRLITLVSVLETYWSLTPSHAEAERWLATVLAAPRVSTDIRASALHLAVSLAFYQCNWPKALTFAEESLAVASASGNALEIGIAHYSLGRIWEHLGDVARATACISEAITAFRQAKVESWAYGTISALGRLRLKCGDVDGAVSLLDEALAYVRELEAANLFTFHARQTLCPVFGQRAHAARAQGDIVLAVQLFVREFTIAREVGGLREALGALAGLAGIAFDLGQPARAARLLGAIDAAWELDGFAHLVHYFEVERLEIELRSVLGENQFAAHWREGQALPFEDAIADALTFAEETDCSP